MDNNNSSEGGSFLLFRILLIRLKLLEHNLVLVNSEENLLKMKEKNTDFPEVY